MEELTGIIENWSVVSNMEYDPYQAPEGLWIFISGRVYQHNKHPDGKKIVTSRIVFVEKDIVTTSSQSKYKLGKPSTEYIKWCENHNYHIPTDEEPIKIM